MTFANWVRNSFNMVDLSQYPFGISTIFVFIFFAVGPHAEGRLQRMPARTMKTTKKWKQCQSHQEKREISHCNTKCCANKLKAWQWNIGNETAECDDNIYLFGFLFSASNATCNRFTLMFITSLPCSKCMQMLVIY